jgi:hypothetical protein
LWRAQTVLVRSLRIVDRITLPAAVTTLWLELHAGLNLRFYSDQGEVEVCETGSPSTSDQGIFQACSGISKRGCAGYL